MSEERSIVILLDGDEAATKATTDLTNFLRNKVPFRSNKEYFLLPRGLPIEGIFPEEWLEELARTHEGWLTIERDMRNNLVSLKMDDSRKMNIANWLMRKGDEHSKENGHYSWANDLIMVLKALNDGLEKKQTEINSKKN